jgi:fluoroquinolone transport system permease protein
MIQITLFRNDIKQILRDPVMTLLLVAPLLLILVFKILEVFLIPFLVQKTGFDVMPYASYIFSFILLMNSGMLGIVTGFMMLDDRDGNIAQLLEITPLGRSGYLLNRLSFASMLSVFYCLISFAVFSLVDLPFYSIILLCFLSAIYTAIIGLLIYSGADDKVKGLTFAKGLNTLVLFAFTDLFALNWLTALSWLFPPYWITMMIKSHDSFLVNCLALAIHVVWLGVLIFRYGRRES